MFTTWYENLKPNQNMKNQYRGNIKNGTMWDLSEKSTPISVKIFKNWLLLVGM